MISLTNFELSVLSALRKSAAGNGDDFGLIEDARIAVPQANQLGGVISSLVKKGIIAVHEAVTTDSGTWTQFTWEIEIEEVEAQTVKWAKHMLAQYPNDGDRYWLTAEGKDVISVLGL
jgi:hypothetical protein